jgi:3-isopropylmalate/(R)-2-methylmalate dehydratase small subunit
VLNEPRYAGATVLIGGKNFGCGSSREHAPWALGDYGFRTVIAPSFADIFFNNCAQNGILLVRLPEEATAELMRRAKQTNGYRLTVDLEKCEVRDDAGFSMAFSVDPFRRRCLLEGLDDISLTLQHEAEIAAFEARPPAWS